MIFCLETGEPATTEQSTVSSRISFIQFIYPPNSSPPRQSSSMETRDALYYFDRLNISRSGPAGRIFYIELSLPLHWLNIRLEKYLDGGNPVILLSNLIKAISAWWRMLQSLITSRVFSKKLINSVTVELLTSSYNICFELESFLATSRPCLLHSNPYCHSCRSYKRL